MIPIRLNVDQNFKSRYLKIINQVIVDNRCTTKNTNKQRKDFYSSLNNELKRIGLKYTIKDIIFADFNTIEKIKQYISDPTVDYKNAAFSKVSNLYDWLCKAKFNLELIEKTNTQVCPYCNREYINSRKTSSSAQLDHFYPRSKFAIFAVSIYNLIPVCYACNHIKREKIIPVCPYDMSFDFDQALKLSYVPHSIDFINNSSELSIEIRTISDVSNNPTDKKDITDNIKSLQIRDAYYIHRDYVSELISKSIIYNDSQIQEYIDAFPNSNLTRAEAQKLVYGNYVMRSDFSKRPLAKLTRDILDELGIDFE